jgi:two-component system cell cycle sensor histidine kinase/response regulator CckA
VLDDEEALRQVASQFLPDRGYRVITAASGEEAVETFRREHGRIDLVVMDLGMPGMGGHKALIEIMAMDAGAKVIIASGYSANVQVKEARESGVKGYVAKPFRSAQLLATLRELLDKE